MSLRYRQVHLDFHTSEHISKIGGQFEKKQFQEALKMGRVDSVTLFSKCHHGWSYHPTEVNEMHPHLSFDLLEKQLEACEEIGVKAPVYISAGYDEKDAVRHPEWLLRDIDDSTPGTADFVQRAGYHLMCFNSGYLDKLLAEVEEVMQRYHPCGIFLDISAVRPWYCSKCRQDIVDRGKDPRDLEAVMEQAEAVYRNYTQKVMQTVHKYDKNCTIFHNGGHIPKGRTDIAGYNTHLELESLPTGGWGYQHFPMSAAYVCSLGMDYLGMTGKFHNAWGEFGGFKHPNALRYETSLNLGLGAKCSIGDQLHPSGKMDMSTYELIGKAYREVEAKEPWCEGSRHCSDIGIISEEAVNSNVSDRANRFWGDIGANGILLEGGYLYSFLDKDSELGHYKLIILPDTIRLDGELQRKISEYIKGGGKVLASGVSGLKEGEERFALDFGADFLGENPYSPDYVLWKGSSEKETGARVMYGQGYCIQCNGGREILRRQNPYFNRDIRHFCSHQHTPNDSSKSYTAGVMTENTAYIGWKIFTDYARMGSVHNKQIVLSVIDMLLAGDKTVQTGLPDRGIVTLTQQEEQARYVLHLLFAHTTIRGEVSLDDISYPMEVIEDIVPLYNIPVCVNVPENIKRIYLAPQMEEISFKKADGMICCLVPEIECHQMVVMEY